LSHRRSGAPKPVFGRQVGRHRLFEHPFARAAALFEPHRNPGGELDQVKVQEGHAHLDPHGHGHLVRIEQVVVAQEEPLLQREHPLQRLDPFGKRGEKGQQGSPRLRAAERRSQVRRVQAQHIGRRIQRK